MAFSLALLEYSRSVQYSSTSTLPMYELAGTLSVAATDMMGNAEGGASPGDSPVTDSRPNAMVWWVDEGTSDNGDA